MGFITNHFTVYKRFCKPFPAICLLAVCWAAVVWALWPTPALRPWREVGAFAVLFTWSALWWRWSVRHPQPLARIGLPVGLLVLVGLTMMPFQSTDVFGYINRGWQQLGYGTNPYITTIEQLPGWQHDPLLTDHWIDNPCPYGVLFAHIARFTCQLGVRLAHDKTLLMMLFKLSQWLVLLAIAWCVDTVRQRWQPALELLETPGKPLPLVALAWHPLVVIHSLANGHNDGWVALSNVLAVGATTLVPVLAPLALTLGGLVKIMPFVALPVTVLSVWRLTGWRSALSSLGWCSVVTIALAWSFVQQPERIQWHLLLDNAGLSHNSLHALLTDLYQLFYRLASLVVNARWLPSDDFIYGWLKGVLWGLYGLLWLYLSSMPCRLKTWTWTRWLAVIVLLQAGLLLIASTKFHAWYLNMILPLLWLLPLRLWWVRGLLGISLAYSFGITFLGRAHIANTLMMTVLPMALAWWWHIYKQKRTSRLHDSPAR
jgi:alpha-1,6-mannosyltransferase